MPVITAPPVPAPKANGNGQAEARRRILIVDDSRDGASTLARMLKLMGNDVRTANDGLEGVEAAGELLPEVVLMDVARIFSAGSDTALLSQMSAAA